MTAEEQKKARRANLEAKVKACWAELALNEELRFVLDHDIKGAFGYTLASFRDKDGFNPHAAALRDGNKEVINWIEGRLKQGRALLDADDSQPEKREAELQFKGEVA